jgi:hypothetical protein
VRSPVDDLKLPVKSHMATENEPIVDEPFIYLVKR